MRRIERAHPWSASRNSALRRPQTSCGRDGPPQEGARP
jgi:hypothetical protein